LDNHSHFKINHDIKKVTRICNNKRTFPDYEEFLADDFLKDKGKCRKQDWRTAENTFYLSSKFEWQYEGEWYVTTEPCLQENGPVFDNENKEDKRIGSCYPYLVWNNGFVWLVRIDNKGEYISKWTDIRYLKNFSKLEI
jgi:hypothetical protein